MKRIRRTAKQINHKFKTAEQLISQGNAIADICSVIKVRQWNGDKGIDLEEIRLRSRLQEIEAEHIRFRPELLGLQPH